LTSNVLLEPVAINFTLKDHTYQVLREAILKIDIYNPEIDLRLDERHLADQLKVSRTPIREALVRLAQEGLVVIQPRKGVFICRKSRREILEMVITWAALESMAARLVTIEASNEDLRDLRKYAMRHSLSAANAELSEYSEANFQFHLKILELSKCSLLKTSAEGLFTHMYFVRRRAMGESDRAKKSVQDHMEIIESLEMRNPELAYGRVLDHTMRLYAHIDTTWARLEDIGVIKRRG
jgi:DNA-binding GntR family transcriptional regulator